MRGLRHVDVVRQVEPAFNIVEVGRAAAHRGTRKNLIDLRRRAVVHSLHVLARLPQPNAV